MLVFFLSAISKSRLAKGFEWSFARAPYDKVDLEAMTAASELDETAAKAFNRRIGADSFIEPINALRTHSAH